MVCENLRTHHVSSAIECSYAMPCNKGRVICRKTISAGMVWEHLRLRIPSSISKQTDIKDTYSHSVQVALWELWNTRLTSFIALNTVYSLSIRATFRDIRAVNDWRWVTLSWQCPLPTTDSGGSRHRTCSYTRRTIHRYARCSTKWHWQPACAVITSITA